MSVSLTVCFGDASYWCIFTHGFFSVICSFPVYGRPYTFQVPTSFWFQILSLCFILLVVWAAWGAFLLRSTDPVTYFTLIYSEPIKCRLLTGSPGVFFSLFSLCDLVFSREFNQLFSHCLLDIMPFSSLVGSSAFRMPLGLGKIDYSLYNHPLLFRCELCYLDLDDC